MIVVIHRRHSAVWDEVFYQSVRKKECVMTITKKEVLGWTITVVAVVFMVTVAWNFAFNKEFRTNIVDTVTKSGNTPGAAISNITVKVVNETPAATSAPAVKTVKTVETSASGVITVILDGAKIDWTPVNRCDLRSWKVPLTKNEEGRIGLVRGWNKGEQPFFIQVPDDHQANWRLRLVDVADAQKLGIYGGILVEHPGTVWVLEFIEDIPPVAEPAADSTPLETPEAEL